MNLQLGLFVWTFFGFLCAFIAIQKNLNPYKWFAAGFLFSIFAFLALLFVPRRNIEKIQGAINTQKMQTILKEETKNKVTLWYYLNTERKQCGPMSFQVLKNDWLKGTINPCTYVWNEDMDNWKPIKDIQDFKRLIYPKEDLTS